MALIGEERDRDGDFRATFRVDDASGVPVALFESGAAPRSTATSDGRYTFIAGTAAARVAAGFDAARSDTANVPAGTAAVEAPALEVQGVGDMIAYPNPYCACGENNPRLFVEFAGSVDTVCVRVRTVSGATVRTVFSGARSLIGDRLTIRGLLTNDQGQPLPAGYYWVTLDRTGPCDDLGRPRIGLLPDREAVLVDYDP